MKAELYYHCGSCGELLTHVAQGMCPICGSQAVLPMGWYQLSIRERSDWLRRIRGLRRRPQPRDTPPQQQSEQQKEP